MSNDECHTPDEFFSRLPFKFTLDAAATAKNTKCADWIGRREDGLNTDWKTRGWVWCNPPFSRSAGGILAWLEQAHSQVWQEHCEGAVVLHIADVSTKAFQFAWDEATEIVLLSPRINFPSPGKTRSGGMQAYQLSVFARKEFRRISKWNWREEDYKLRSSK